MVHTFRELVTAFEGSTLRRCDRPLDLSIVSLLLAQYQT